MHGVGVVSGCDLFAKRNVFNPCFFSNFTQCGIGNGFIGLYFAFGQIPPPETFYEQDLIVGIEYHTTSCFNMVKTLGKAFHHFLGLGRAYEK